MVHVLVPPVVENATRRAVLAALGAAGLLAACGSPSPTGSAAPDCRPFAGDQGTVCVPPTAERIVAANYFSFEILQALGIAPVAVTGVADLPTYLGGGALDLPDIGTFQEPDVEAIALLRPEAVFGNPEPEGAEVLGRLAPFVAIDTQVPEPWQRATQRHADALGVPERAAALIADHEARVAALAARIGDPGATAVSLVSVVAGDGVGIVGDGRAAGALLRDLGFDRPSGQRGIENFLFPSPEEYALLDGDLMLVHAFGAAEQVQRLRAGFVDSALYPTLGAVRDGRVVEVGPHWFFHGPTAARLMLGDLERMYP